MSDWSRADTISFLGLLIAAFGCVVGIASHPAKNIRQLLYLSGSVLGLGCLLILVKKSEVPVLSSQTKKKKPLTESIVDLSSHGHNVENMRENLDSPHTLNRIAWHCVTCPEPKHLDPDLGLSLALLAVEGDSTSPSYQDTLAAAYAAKGDFLSAITSQERAISMVESSNSSFAPERLTRMNERLDKYRRRQSYRDEKFLR